MSETIQEDILKEIVQVIPGSTNTDTVTCRIVRVSDGYTWDFVNEEFSSGDHSGSMEFVSDTIWRNEFTPDEQGEYVVYVEDETIGVEYSLNYTVTGGTIIPPGDYADDLTVGTNTFVTAVEAETYFATRWGATAHWSGLSDSQKVAALVTAYNQIDKSGCFSLPEDVTAEIKMAQCEQALFLVIHGDDVLARGGLQAQGVLSSQVSKETYDPTSRGRLPICAEAYELLRSYYVRSEGNFTLEVERDDNA